MKQCKWCLLLKDFDCFYTVRNSLTGHCKDCDNARRRISNMTLEQIKRKRERELVKNLTPEALERKRVKQRKSAKQRYQNLTLEVKELKNSQKRIKNLSEEKIIKRRMQAKNRIKKIDKIRQTVTSNILNALKKRGSSKNGKSIFNHLPYTLFELKSHLENLFESWMSWNNHGKYNALNWDDNDSGTWTWQIDHIIPHSKFRYLSLDSSDFLACWSLNNLRPLAAKRNSMEGNRR